MLYYAFTTLSTIGFGDYYPKSDAERVFCIIILLSGVSNFSLIKMNCFRILTDILNLYSDYEEDEELSMFLKCLDRFNENTPIKQSFRDEVVKFFDFKWKNDKNICIKKDYMLYEQLPEDVQIATVTKAIHADFIVKFFKFFRFQKPNRQFYTWMDQQYQEFMMDILFSLEPRYYYANSMLYDELETVHELIFLHDGLVGIGFRINQGVKYVEFQKDYCVVGTYDLIKNVRTEFVYQTFSHAMGQAIRK